MLYSPRRRLVIVFVFVLTALGVQAAPVLKVLFLGDSGLHQPAARVRDLGPALMSRGIQLVYTEDITALTLENLRRYDGLLIYANIDQIAPVQEQALLDYVTEGGGLVALHSASYCFRNSDRYVALVGAQFKSHQAGVFRTRIVAPEHPVMQGFSSFESWDETYVHTRHNPENRTVLEQRDEEPWTWVRSEGKGRVFYTAWGHDARTWSNSGFHDLVERGIRFAAGQKLPTALTDRPKVPAFDLTDQAGIPYYPPGQRSQGDSAWPQMAKPLSPSDSMQHLIVPAGFEVQLVASEPDIRKPIAMAWDERGRLWLAETLDYPNKLLEPGQLGRDQLIICDDTDRDGRMDKFTVFADGLNIPTGFTFANGGVILLQAPHTLFLKDTNGDDRADLREILFTGWGRSDTHAGPNNLVYGFDNWIWGMLGYAGFSGSVSGDAFSFRQGFYRFRPDGSKFEFLRATNNNTWGIGFTEEGLVFGSTANNNPSVYLPIPNRFYPPAGMEAKTLGTIASTSRFLALTGRVRQVDVHWGYTAAAGHAFYTARAYPKEYWNRIAFVAEPSGHLVGQLVIESSGANFRATNPTNLIVSDDEWFAPIMAEVGPDGAVWIIDWYNYIVQHNPTPKGYIKGAGNAYENELRDQRFGRIYRIVWNGDSTSQAPARPAFTLAGASPALLVSALSNDNLLWRRHAQRLLVERGRKDVVPALLDLITNPRVDEIGLNVGAIHALWTLHGLHAIDALADALSIATHALNHPSAGVRLTAANVLPRTSATLAAVLRTGMLNDADPQVRLAGLLALAECPGPPSLPVGEALRTLLDQPKLTLDRWTVDGARIAATAHSKTFLTAAKPAQLAAAREMNARKSLPFVVLDTFEHTSASSPSEWKLRKISGEASVSIVQPGYKSGRSLQLAATNGADASASRGFKVKPNTRYELSAYVKTSDVIPIGAALGVLIAVPQVQRPRSALSIATKGTSDWALIKLSFDTGTLEEISVACVLGSGGPASGTAWFDEFNLVDQGPSDETVADPYIVVLAHVISQTSGRASDLDITPSDAGITVLQLGVVPDVMKYDATELTVKAGEKVKLIFRNNDHMQHNALILRPGKAEAVGALADAMLADPRALAQNFVPASPDVIFNVPLVNPGESYELIFTAPSKPGRYPIVCTFPGHWRIMQSMLVVK